MSIVLDALVTSVACIPPFGPPVKFYKKVNFSTKPYDISYIFILKISNFKKYLPTIAMYPLSQTSMFFALQLS